MKTKKIIRIALAIIGGEIALILFATVAQEVLFDGIGYSSSSAFDFLFGGLATFTAAVLAGVVARMIIKDEIKIIPVAISIIITAEIAYLILTNKTGDPAWFDIMGGGSLIVGVWLGFYYLRFLPFQKAKATA